MGFSNINDVLRHTGSKIHGFRKELAEKPTAGLSQDRLDDIAHTIEEANQALDQAKSQKGLSIDHDNAQNILSDVEFIQYDKASQEKVGALHAALFNDVLTNFHDLLKNLEEKFKRGERVEGIDEQGPL